MRVVAILLTSIVALSLSAIGADALANDEVDGEGVPRITGLPARMVGSRMMRAGSVIDFSSSSDTLPQSYSIARLAQSICRSS